MPKPQLVVFDINSTLVHDNTFLKLNTALGMTQKEDRLFYDLNQEGVMPNDMWVELVNNIYQKRGKATRHNIEAAILNYTYVDGAKQCLIDIQKAGVKVALLSGSVDLFVKSIADDLKVALWRASAQLYFNDDDTLDRLQYMDEDEVAKRRNFEELCETEKVAMEDVICIGDGSNERELFQLARGVTFAGSKVADQAWKVVPSIREVAKAILEE